MRSWSRRITLVYIYLHNDTSMERWLVILLQSGIRPKLEKQSILSPTRTLKSLIFLEDSARKTNQEFLKKVRESNFMFFAVVGVNCVGIICAQQKRLRNCFFECNRRTTSGKSSQEPFRYLRFCALCRLTTTLKNHRKCTKPRVKKRKALKTSRLTLTIWFFSRATILNRKKKSRDIKKWRTKKDRHFLIWNTWAQNWNSLLRCHNKRQTEYFHRSPSHPTSGFQSNH